MSHGKLPALVKEVIWKDNYGQLAIKSMHDSHVNVYDFNASGIGLRAEKSGFLVQTLNSEVLLPVALFE